MMEKIPYQTQKLKCDLKLVMNQLNISGKLCQIYLKNSRAEEVRIGSTFGATIPVQVKKVRCNALVDTGATRSCISREFHEILQSPTLKTVQRSKVISANGSTINVLGITTCPVTIGKKLFNVDFLVCDNIRRPCYIGLDFLRKK